MCSLNCTLYQILILSPSSSAPITYHMPPSTIRIASSDKHVLNYFYYSFFNMSKNFFSQVSPLSSSWGGLPPWTRTAAWRMWMNFRFLIPHSGFLIKGTELKLVRWNRSFWPWRSFTDLFSLSINSRRTLLVQRFDFFTSLLLSSFLFVSPYSGIRNQKLEIGLRGEYRSRTDDLLNANQAL